MMNRDPYNYNLHLPPQSSSSSIIMPFGLDHYNNWDHTQVIQPNFDLHSPLALPLGPTPFYTPQLVEYPAAAAAAGSFMVMKREDGGGRGSRPIGLNLGHRTYFLSGGATSIDQRLSVQAAQHHHHHHQPPRCQAEECKADLSGAKHYHRRHKVCEFHSKATVVIAGGIQQRFCQQCSRFHVLSEFDESKRSCRKRLADHNRRRRKPHNNNNSSSSTDKTKPSIAPQRPSIDSSCNSSKCTTTTSTTTATSNGGGLEWNQGDQGKAILFRNGPALSLGGRTQHHEGLYNNNYNNIFYNNHQSLRFGSTSSNDASHQSTGTGDGPGSGSDQHQTNLLHLGQAMFQVDFV